jgi:hypothetical protein
MPRGAFPATFEMTSSAEQHMGSEGGMRDIHSNSAPRKTMVTQRGSQVDVFGCEGFTVCLVRQNPSRLTRPLKKALLRNGWRHLGKRSRAPSPGDNGQAAQAMGMAPWRVSLPTCHTT